MQMPRPIREWTDVDKALFDSEIVPRHQPAVLKGLVKDWPAVAAGCRSAEDVCNYLVRFYQGAPVEAFVGPSDIAGRFFYRPDMSGFNFEKKRARLSDVLSALLIQMEAKQRPALYVGAALLSETLPGFESENLLSIVKEKRTAPRVWIGNETTVSTHFDLSDNIACVVAGRRRFTIFPPDQIDNLYVGPLDHTMAGQPASMVSVRDPDLERYPRFEKALEAAEVAELDPGDAIYVPSLWWHQVDALEPFNILVNYWWDDAPADAGSAFEAMVHGILAIRNLPEASREEWRILFDHYVFGRNGDAAAHLAPEHRGILGPSTRELRARIKRFLVHGLSRSS